MSYYFPNLDPVYIYKRKGTDDDPFLFLIDTNFVSHEAITLREIPQFEERVRAFLVEDDSELIEVESDTLAENEFRIDYSVGTAHFNEVINGKQVRLEYYGTGYVSFPAERIWVYGENDDPLETLQDALSRVGEGIDTLGQVGNLDFKGDFDIETSYKKWNFVSYGGKTYVAIADTIGNLPTDISYWRMVSSGVGFIGIYDSTKTYSFGDVVSGVDNKNLYISKTENNNYPLTDENSWDILLTLDDAINFMEQRIEQQINDLGILKQQLVDDENIRHDNETNRESTFNNTILDLSTLKQQLIDDEGTRIDSENDRVNSENTRKINEVQRKEAELIRSTNESQRISQELTRQQEVQDALSAIQEAINNTDENIDTINLIKDSLTDMLNQVTDKVGEVDNALSLVDDFSYKGEYSPEIQYVRYNIVTHEGSSYIALRETIANDVYDTYFWGVLSLKGINGDQIAVNGILPDEDGNISLDSLQLVDVDMLTLAKEELNNNQTSQIGDMALLQTLRKDTVVSAINELKRRIDDIIDILT